MEDKLEQVFLKGHQEYLKLPKAEHAGENRNAELYCNKWCIVTGHGFAHPEPHRHFSFLEFVFFCGKDEKLYNRFVVPFLDELSPFYAGQIKFKK